MSDYHPAVKCEKCGSGKLKLIAPLRLHFQPHVQCQKCKHEELEILTFMRAVPAMQDYDAKRGKVAQ
jgi:hypothetical protein